MWRAARARLAPGDRVLFRRGQIFRGQMRLECAGAPGNPIVFTAYGEGPPPSLRGTVLRSDPADWTDAGGGVWYLAGLHRDPILLVADGRPGRRVAKRADLSREWDHCFDPRLGRLLVKTRGNPARFARSIEIGENDHVLGPVTGSHLTFAELDLSMPRASTVLSWGGGDLVFTDCSFTLSPVNHLQFHRRSGPASVRDCRFDDWNLSHDAAYAIQAIEGSGPVDVERCVFAASLQGGGRDHTAIMSDLEGWVRSVTRCRFEGNGGRLADDGAVVWRLSGKADVVDITDNIFEGLGGTAVILQETGHFGARPQVRVAANTIRAAVQGDDLDKEALRVRDTRGATVVVENNLIEGTRPGNHAHDGISADSAPDLLIRGNAVHGADDALRVGGGTSAVRVIGNRLTGNRAHGLLVMPGSGLGESSGNCLWGNGKGPVHGAPLGRDDIPAKPSSAPAPCDALP